MSMKRTKARGSDSTKNGESNFWDKPVEKEKKYEEIMEGKSDEQFKAYAMTGTFVKGDLLTHPKFGKGVVTDVEPQRVEIMFADGKKKLGHGAT